MIPWRGQEKLPVPSLERSHDSMERQIEGSYQSHHSRGHMIPWRGRSREATSHITLERAHVDITIEERKCMTQRYTKYRSDIVGHLTCSASDEACCNCKHKTCWVSLAERAQPLSVCELRFAILCCHHNTCNIWSQRSSHLPHTQNFK